MNRTMTKYAMAQVVSFGSLIKEERDQIQTIHVGFMVESVANGYFFLRVLQFSPITITQQMLHIHSFIHNKRYKTLKFRESSSNTKGSTVAAPAISTKTNFFAHMNIAPPPTRTLPPKDFSAFMENGSRNIMSDELQLRHPRCVCNIKGAV